MCLKSEQRFSTLAFSTLALVRRQPVVRRQPASEAISGPTRWYAFLHLLSESSMSKTKMHPSRSTVTARPIGEQRSTLRLCSRAVTLLLSAALTNFVWLASPVHAQTTVAEIKNADDVTLLQTNATGETILSGDGNRLTLGANDGSDPVSSITWAADNDNEEMRFFWQPTVNEPGFTRFALRTNGDAVIPDGNLGVGTVDPFTPLRVLGSEGEFRVHPIFPSDGAAAGTTLLGAWEGANGDGPQVRFLGAGTSFFDIGQRSDGSFAIEGDDTPRLTVMPDGNVGVGTTTPISRLSVNGAISVSGSANDALAINASGADSPDLTFSTSADEQWRIDQFGDGGSQPWLRFNTAIPDGPGFAQVSFRTNGNVAISGTLSESSDRGLKTDIQPLGPALKGLLSLPAVRYRFKEETGRSTNLQIGLIAQDVQAVFPELVISGSDGHLSLAYPKLTAVLLQGLQEQQAQIETLEARLAALEQGARLSAPASVLGGGPSFASPTTIRRALT